MRKAIAIGIVCAALALPLWTSTAAAQSSGAWLDATPVKNWNKANAAVPRAPKMSDAVSREYAEFFRKPQVPVDTLVTQAGWKLYGAVQLFGPATVVTALAGFDGMGRPLQYQGFVFVNGGFVGTISPTPMDSRTDGSESVITLVGENSLLVEYLRYKESDALCCPSATSYVTFTIDKAGKNGLLTVNDVSTEPNSKQ